MFPTIKLLLISNSYPSSAGFCIADGHENRTLHQPIRFRTWFTWANLRRNIEKTKFQKDFFLICGEKMLFSLLTISMLHI